jgi:hypothetical protein
VQEITGTSPINAKQKEITGTSPINAKQKEITCTNPINAKQKEITCTSPINATSSGHRFLSLCNYFLGSFSRSVRLVKSHALNITIPIHTSTSLVGFQCELPTRSQDFSLKPQFSQPTHQEGLYPPNFKWYHNRYVLY